MTEISASARPFASRIPGLLVAGALMLAGTLPATAQTEMGFGASGDPSAPIEVNSDNLSVDQQDGSAVFEGNVRIAQNEMRLSADQVQVFYDADGEAIDTLRASGQVLLVSGEDSAEAETADYNVHGGIILMQGNVMLLRGASVVTSQKMNVDLASGTARLEGNVRTVLQQQGKN
ncbi:LptA/OstA family protein [Pseudooceanicola algae]|uniref:Lipopolysaccharide export system protein LptA n=1 Tax=Pseudooceanicola algae TaxID=1537215 RepID=A0A418SBA5_9RHOB|nr:LptA/OstA family protein [Pseudooceanicola algae]QPM91397.1 Lipopolysaccharide export system protein LptA [Pseudooceanicola algae]